MAARAQAKQAEEALGTDSSCDLGRRRLLHGIASGGGALALVGLAGESLPAAPGADAKPSTGDPRRLGFEATDHVRWYYGRARW